MDGQAGLTVDDAGPFGEAGEQGPVECLDRGVVGVVDEQDRGMDAVARHVTFPPLGALVVRPESVLVVLLTVSFCDGRRTEWTRR
jgi:hypothetical protein